MDDCLRPNAVCKVDDNYKQIPAVSLVYSPFYSKKSRLVYNGNSFLIQTRFPRPILKVFPTIKSLEIKIPKMLEDRLDLLGGTIMGPHR